MKNNILKKIKNNLLKEDRENNLEDVYSDIEGNIIGKKLDENLKVKEKKVNFIFEKWNKLTFDK